MVKLIRTEKCPLDLATKNSMRTVLTDLWEQKITINLSVGKDGNIVDLGVISKSFNHK